MKAKLSDRIRPNSEVLPWIYEEIKLLENQLDEKDKAYEALEATQQELNKEIRQRQEKDAQLEAMRESIKEAYDAIKAGSELWPVWVGTPSTTYVHQGMLSALAKLQPFLTSDF